MRQRVECLPCYLNQAISTFLVGKVDEQKQKEFMAEIIKELPKLNYDKTPGENTSLVLQRACELMGNSDPYKEAKRESNELALSIYDELKDTVDKSEDPLFTSFQMAVAGNIIDMGIIRDYDIHGAIHDALNIDFGICDYDKFKDMLKDGYTILIIGDNSGEIVFDKLLVEELNKLGKETIYAVKEEPILNDATMEDVYQSGMDKIAKVITNGNEFCGTIFEKCSDEFLDTFDSADIIIAKGQANYESLEGESRAGDKTFFILKAKCGSVADNLGVEQGTNVFVQNVIKHVQG